MSKMHFMKIIDGNEFNTAKGVSIATKFVTNIKHYILWSKAAH